LMMFVLLFVLRMWALCFVAVMFSCGVDACAGVEMFKKSLDQGQAGDNVGVLLRGLKREDVLRGQVLAAPGTVQTYKTFKAEVYVLKQDEGGRHTPFFNNYRCVQVVVCVGSVCLERVQWCVGG